jgi:hypothetical protein
MNQQDFRLAMDKSRPGAADSGSFDKLRMSGLRQAQDERGFGTSG